MDRRAIWARNFRRFGLSEDTSQRSTPHCRQQAPLLQGDEDRRGRGRRDGLLEPGQRGPAGGGVDGQQAVEPGLAVPGQDWRQPPVRLLLRPLPGRGDEALQVGDPRPLDPEAEQVLAGQAQKQGGSVVLQGSLHEPGFEPGQVAGGGLAEAEVAPDLPEVLRPRLPPLAVPRQLARGNVELPRHEGDDDFGGGADVVGAEAKEAECAELEGEPQAVGGRGRPGELPAVGPREGEVGLDVAGDDLGGESVEPIAFRVAEEPDGHGGLLRGTAAPGFSQRNDSEKAWAFRGRCRRTGVFRFSETILGIAFSPVYGYDEFRER